MSPKKKLRIMEYIRFLDCVNALTFGWPEPEFLVSNRFEIRKLPVSRARELVVEYLRNKER